MASFVKSALYVKNVPPWERALRVLGALAIAAFGFYWLSSPWSWLVAASAAGVGLTGVVGFCPMCALAGRRLDRQS
jgi:hypothetical protein